VALRREAGGSRALTVPRIVLDALSLGLAYYLAFALRFGGEPPRRYEELFIQTLPFAVLGGVVCLGLVGAYRGRAVRVINGVALATLSLIAYAALVQPVLVLTADGLRVLNVPAGVCVIFAMTATMLMLATRLASAAGAAVVARR
jgi:hypothetical protein